MRTHHRYWLFGLFAVGIASWAASLPGRADDGLVVEEHAAERLAVFGLVGSLVVEGEDRSDIRLELRGSPDALARLRREVHGDQLELMAAPGPQGRTTVVSSRNNIVIASSGGRATQIIGDQVTTVEGTPAPELELRVHVPQGAPLVISGFVGELAVEGVAGRVELALVSGSAQLDQVAGGRLAAVGGSRIAVGRASGELAIDVRGAGDVTVATAALERLDVGITGSGNVGVGGSAEEARVRLTGSGRVQVAEVRARPAIRVTGSGAVDIGNW